MKKLIFIFSIFFIDFKTFSQTFLPTFHGVHHTKKIPTNGLVAYFDFSSGELGYTLGSGVEATTDKNGNANSAVQLDSQGEIISGQFSELLDDDFTVSIWAKHDGYAGRKMWLISFGSPNSPNPSKNQAFHLGIHNNGNYRVGSWSAGHGTNVYLGNDDSWKHYVVTYDKSEKIYKFYINNTISYNQTNHNLSLISKDFIIGSQLFWNNENWNGKIDEFGLWNRILTSQEITDLYNSY